MTHIARTITIDATASEVFAILQDLDRLPELSEMTVEVRNAPGRPIQTGDRFDQIVRVAGVEIDTEWEVTEVVVDSLVRVEGRSKSNGNATMTERVIAAGAACRVELDVDYDPPFGLLGEIADKIVFERRHEDEAEQILGRLESLCETAIAP